MVAVTLLEGSHHGRTHPAKTTTDSRNPGPGRSARPAVQKIQHDRGCDSCNRQTDRHVRPEVLVSDLIHGLLRTGRCRGTTVQVSIVAPRLDAKVEGAGAR